MGNLMTKELPFPIVAEYSPSGDRKHFIFARIELLLRAESAISALLAAISKKRRGHLSLEDLS
jgi:hypothetical protein